MAIATPSPSPASSPSPVPHGIERLDVPLEQLLAELRASQPGSDLAEQRHFFLDVDADSNWRVPSDPNWTPRGGAA